MTRTTLLVSGMTCNHCKMSVTTALANLPGVERVEVNLQTKSVEVDHDDRTSRQSLTRAVEEVGFEVTE